MSETTGDKPCPATRGELQELHRLLAEHLLYYMRNTPQEKLRATKLEVLRAFLKDNGVTKDLTSSRDIAQALEEISSLDLPFIPDYLASDKLN